MGNGIANQISKYYQSFSGTDTLAFIMMPGCSPVIIGSLTTISYSMYRNKKPVINIGRTNINGVTRGSRIFAGTMIFTLINQHWLKELQQQGSTWLSNYGYSKINGEWVPNTDYDLKVDDLPLFDIMIVSANEYGHYVSMYIYGIDFTDEAQTISVEDLFTENTFSFIARDISNFKAGTKNNKVSGHSKGANKVNDFSQKFYVLNSSTTNLDDLTVLEKEMTLSKVKQLRQEKHHTLARNLYYSSSKTIMGDDVAHIQMLLNQTKMFDIPVNGIFDKDTSEAIRKYQSMVGDDIDGIVDDKLYNILLNHIINNEKRALGVVVNKYGAYVYKDPSYQSDIVDTRQYRDQVEIYEYIVDDEDKSNKWYKTSNGYIAEEDLYSAYYTGSVIEFPKLQYGDNGAYVTIVQTALTQIDSSYTNITGEYDYETQLQVKKIQEENGLEPTGVVDNDTWLLFQSLSGNVATQVSNDNFDMEFKTSPGTYNLSSTDVLDNLSLFDIDVSCDNNINIKASAVCLYDDNTFETFTQTVNVKGEQTITLSDLKNAFTYNPEHGKTPKQVDYIIYPYNKTPYKWTITYS